MKKRQLGHIQGLIEMKLMKPEAQGPPFMEFGNRIGILEEIRNFEKRIGFGYRESGFLHGEQG